MKPRADRQARARGAWTAAEHASAATALLSMPERLRQGMTDITDGYLNTDDAVNTYVALTAYWTARQKPGGGT